MPAAHCFRSKDRNEKTRTAQLVKALLGKYDLNVKNETGAKSHLVSEIVIHDDWNILNSEYDADIAILVLNEEAMLNKYVQPVCLPAENEEVTENGIVVGWGKSSTGSNDAYKPTPQQLQLPVIDNDTCYNTFPELKTHLASRLFCGGFVNQSKATCTGDSGGGMHFMNEDASWTVRGIVSVGLAIKERECNANAYTLFTDVAKFRNWIIDVMKGTKPKTLQSIRFLCERERQLK